MNSPQTDQATGWEELDRRSCPRWFDEAKLGLFIHYGPYSNPKAQPERWEFERPEYLTAENFQAEEWVQTALKCGFRYLTFTTKHGGGYAMFDSRHTAYNSFQTGPRRDFVRELSVACAGKGLRFLAYYCKDDIFLPDTAPATAPIKIRDLERYENILAEHGLRSVRDNWPAYFQGQIRELAANYPIDGFWLDGTRLPSEYVGTRLLLEELYAASPEIVVNDRVGTAFERKKHGDFFTYEREWLKPVHILPRKWERAAKLSHDWWWTGADAPLNMEASDLLWDIIDTIALGGNYAVGVGPRPDGSLPQKELAVMSALGEWLSRNGEAVYGSKPWTWGYYRQGERIRFTLAPDENVVYAFVHGWPGDGLLKLDRFNDGMPIVTSMKLLATGQPLSWHNPEQGLVRLPEKKPAGLPVYVVRVEIERASVWGREGKVSLRAQE